MNRIIVIVAIFLTSVLGTTSPSDAQTVDSPRMRMRPIGSPSVVDRYNRNATPMPTSQRLRETGSRGGYAVQPAAWMQNFEVPPLPGGDGPPVTPSTSGAIQPGGALQPGVPQAGAFNPPPLGLPPSLPPQSVPSALPQTSVPQTAVPRTPIPQSPRTLPANPNAADDYAPLNQPSLGNQFATISNSCHVTGPSTYTAASASGCCAPVNYQTPPAYAAPVAGPTIAPPAFAAPAAPIAANPTGNGVPRGSLISFGQERYPVQVGPGLFGQPVAYVPGQTFRNWLRYIFP